MGSLFSSDVKSPPKPNPPAPMPDEESPLVKEAGRNQAIAMIGSSGRRSTILSRPFQSGPSTNFDTFDRARLGS